MSKYSRVSGRGTQTSAAKSAAQWQRQVDTVKSELQQIERWAQDEPRSFTAAMRRKQSKLQDKLQALLADDPNEPITSDDTTSSDEQTIDQWREQVLATLLQRREVEVQTDPNPHLCIQFTIVPYQENNFSLRGYGVRVKGNTHLEAGYKMMGRAELADWLRCLYPQTPSAQTTL